MISVPSKVVFELDNTALWTLKICYPTEFDWIYEQSNIKTRNTAYDILVQVGHSLKDADPFNADGKLLEFFTMVSSPSILSLLISNA